MAYQVIIPKAVQKTLSKLPRKVQLRIIDKIMALRENPRPSGYIKLKGTKDRYRIRIGNYRAVYQINDKELLVLIIDVDDRKDIFKD